MTVKEEKTALRKELLSLRRSLSPEDRKAASEKIRQNLMDLASYRFSDTILFYAPLADEPDIFPLAAHALSQGKKVAFPISHPDDCTLAFHLIASTDELKAGCYGVREPSDMLPCYQNLSGQHALCIVPGLSFDKSGFRLGYGKGYYDRFLSGFSGCTIGIVFYPLLRGALPHGKYDRPVDLILTERGVQMPNET